MISDALLRSAAAEAEAHLLKCLPEDQVHQFSAGFERKMKRLISRANHPIRHQILRYAAAVLLAVLTLFGAVLAVSPEARAAVVGWVKNTFYEFVEYSNNGINTPKTSGYHLTYIPDGYELLDVIKSTGQEAYVYVDDSGKTLRFIYTYAETDNSVFLLVEDYQQHSGFVHGTEADIFVAIKDGESSVIIWCDEETGVLFRVHAYADREILIKLAEGVKKDK